MRGENYTFRVFGGNDASIANRASYHPFYITNSSSGGRLLSTQDQRTVRPRTLWLLAYACLSNSTSSFGVFSEKHFVRILLFQNSQITCTLIHSYFNLCLHSEKQCLLALMIVINLLEVSDYVNECI